MSNKKWIKFNGTIRDIGNHGKSRGINVSMLTKHSDIGRHIEGQFRFTTDLPDTTEIEKQRKEQIVTLRTDKILDVKINCFNNMMMMTAKESGMRAELLLTQHNLDIYLELLAQFTAIDTIINKMIQQKKPQKLIQEQEQQLKQQIINKIESTNGAIPIILIKAVENDVLEGYTQSFIDKLVDFSENIMKDRSLVWKRKRSKKKK